LISDTSTSPFASGVSPLGGAMLCGGLCEQTPVVPIRLTRFPGRMNRMRQL
jgi:hypothetical protein